MQSPQALQHLQQSQMEAAKEQSDKLTFSQNIHYNPQKLHEANHDVDNHPSKKEGELDQNKEPLDDKNNNKLNKQIEACRSEQHSPQRNQLNYNTYSPEPKKHKKVEQQHTHSDEQEGEGKGYQQLTMKLETALNKISSAKKGPSQTMSNTIWRRAEECAQKKKKDLERKREQSQQMKSKQIRAKPTINKNSERLAKEVGYQPIYNRYEKLLEAKQRKNKEIEQIKKKQKQEEEANFIQELNRHMRRPETVRTYDAYFDEMVKWKERTAKQNRQKMEMQKSKELEGVTFKPNLNPKSKKMVSSQSRLPIDQRGLVKGQTKTEYPLRYGMTRGSGK